MQDPVLMRMEMNKIYIYIDGEDIDTVVGHNH